LGAYREAYGEDNRGTFYTKVRRKSFSKMMMTTMMMRRRIFFFWGFIIQWLTVGATANQDDEAHGEGRHCEESDTYED